MSSHVYILRLAGSVNKQLSGYRLLKGYLQKYGLCKNRLMFNFFPPLPDKTIVSYFSVYNPLLFTPWTAWCRVYNECGLYECGLCPNLLIIMVKFLLPYVVNVLFFLYFTDRNQVEIAATGGGWPLHTYPTLTVS